MAEETVCFIDIQEIKVWWMTQLQKNPSYNKGYRITDPGDWSNDK